MASRTRRFTKTFRSRRIKTQMKDDRLEILSDMVRKGQPIDFSEAMEVINYQENLKLERRKNSFVYKVKKHFGVEE